MMLRDFLAWLLGGRKPKPVPPPPPPLSLPPGEFGETPEILLAMFNSARKGMGQSALILEAAPMQWAQTHAQAMADHSRQTHASLGDGTLEDRANASGYAWSKLAENIDAGASSPQEVVQAWMSSSGHRANILGPYTSVGFGIAINGPTIYWCADFATPA